MMKGTINRILIGCLMMLVITEPARAALVSADSTQQMNQRNEKVEALGAEIEKIMLVRDGSGSDEEMMAFQNNINATKANQNKMMLNAASRAIAMGQRAVALATKAGKDDIEEMGKVIEQSDDLMNMLRQIAELESQHLQKINQITSLRGKMVELDALNNIMSGNVYAKNGEGSNGEQ